MQVSQMVFAKKLREKLKSEILMGHLIFST